MGALDIAAQEVIVAYGESSSSWAASTINTWIGVIAGALVLLNGWRIIKNDTKDESQKIKDVALMSVAAILVVGVVMLFITNKYGTVTTHVTELGN